jgi:peptide/nickel transport system substrate-binding protein
VRTQQRSGLARLSGLLALMVSALLVLAACSSGGSTEKSSAPSDSLVSAWPADVATLDPGNVATDQDKELTMNIYQRLLEYKFTKDANGSLVWNGLDAEASLASSYDLTGSSAIFHLRTDVKFYPSGNPLTAQDVLFSYVRSMALGGATDLSNGGLLKPTQFSVVDDHTFKMDFTDVAGNPVPATPTLIATMRFPNFGIVDSVTAKQHATAADPNANDWLRSNSAGTGPYYVSSRSPGQQLVLKAVPSLWSGEPTYKTVTIRVVNNGNIASLVRSGQVNVGLFGLTQKELNDLKGEGLTVDHQATPDFIHLQLAEDSGPFTDERVRQAVADVIPYDDIVKNIFFGRAERALSYVNLKAPGYDKAWSMYTTDVTKAKALMTAAGNPAINVPLQYSNAEPAYEDMAILIQSALKQIGITVTLQPQTPAAMFDLIIKRGTAAAGTTVSAPEMVMFNLSIYLDDPKSPVSFYSHSGGALNYPRFSNAAFDATANQFQFQADSPARQAAYADLQKQAATDASFIPLVITGRTVVVSKGITGIAYSPEIGVRYWTLTNSGASSSSSS